MNATCEHCSTIHVQVDRNEDGSPAIETTRCADPDCEVELCEAGCADLSFFCTSCNFRFCNEHRIKLGKATYCFGCVIEAAA